MDRKQLISAISLSVAVFALWTVFEMWYAKHYPPVAETPSATQPAAPDYADSGTTNPSAHAAMGTTLPASMPSGQVMSAGLHAVAPATQPSPIMASLGSDVKGASAYKMQVRLVPEGAGIAQVTLNEFPSANSEKLKKNEKPPYVFELPFETHPGTAALATRTLIIDDKPVDLWNVPWTQVSASVDSATFSVQLADADGPLAEVVKTYHVDPSSNENKGYEVTVEQTVKSLRAGRTLKVRAIINGPTPPPAEVEQGSDRTVSVGYVEAKGTVVVKQHADTDFKPDSPKKDLTIDDTRHFGWAGQVSSYFAALVLPDSVSPFTVNAEALDPGAETNRNVSLTFETADLQATPQEAASVKLHVYFGPKWRDVLGSSYYAAFPRMYDEVLVTRSSMCAWCTFPWLIHGLVGVLGFFHLIFRDWGLAIICLVLCVRALLHPITKQSQVKMMKMGKLSPEVEKLKLKYKDRPDELNREMMKVYKEQGGAILGCLPMFLQTPIWIALWSALQSTFELRQAPFLYGFTWIHDLAKPDRLIQFGQTFTIPLIITTAKISAINILPILMAVVTYINQKYFMPMPIAATPEQQQQQKMQRGMSLLFPLMFYSLPSGLTIYYLTSMSLGILESKIIRDHIKKQEEAEKAGRIFITAKPTRASKRRDGLAAPDVDEKPGMVARLMMKMHEIQVQAEAMRKEQEKKDKRK